MTKPKPPPSTDTAYLLKEEVALLCRCSDSSITRRVQDSESDFPRPVQFVPRGTWLFNRREIEEYLETKRLSTLATASPGASGAVAAVEAAVPLLEKHEKPAIVTRPRGAVQRPA